MQPQQLPNDLGSLEQDVGPPPQGGRSFIPADQPAQGGSGEPDTGPIPPQGSTPPNVPQEGSGEPDTGPSDDEIKAHLDSLEEQDKAFLAEHLTPEFVRAISLISGPAVGNYLNKYADQEKVLVPVPRKVAEEHMRQQQGAQAQPAPQQQAQASPAPQAPAQGGMMSPMQPPATS